MESGILVEIAKIGGALGAVILIFKYAKKFLIFLKAFSEMPDKIKKIEAEIKTNGGSSIKDQISRIETRQLTQEKRSQFFFETTEIASFETSAEGTITKFNSTFLNVTNKSADELVGNHWVNLTYSENRDQIFKRFEESSKQKRDFQETVEILNKKDQKIKFYCKIAPVIKESNILSWIGILKFQE